MSAYRSGLGSKTRPIDCGSHSENQDIGVK